MEIVFLVLAVLGLVVVVFIARHIDDRAAPQLRNSSGDDRDKPD
jgi:hypothetical protein